MGRTLLVLDRASEMEEFDVKFRFRVMQGHADSKSVERIIQMWLNDLCGNHPNIQHDALQVTPA